ncbi:hypothetical protein BsWGS_15398 [Bradybaena similaris]
MSEKTEIVSNNDSVKIPDTVVQNTSEENPPEAITDDQNVKHENGSLDGSVKIQDKDPHSMPTRTMMSGLPPINLNQLNTILRDPSMPSQEIMKEVADKMMLGLGCEDSESDDNSTGGVVGMQRLLDCIIDVTIQRPDSDNSDDDESFQRIRREIPCSICNKIFGSTMKWKTHVLVAHQDPSVLNIKRLSNSESDKKGKCNTTHRRNSRNTSKPDTGGTDNKIRHLPRADSKHNAEALRKEESLRENQRPALIVRPLQAAKPVSLSDKHHIEGQVSPKGNKDTCSGESEKGCKDAHVDTYKVKDCVNSLVNAGLLQIPESPHRNIDSAEDKEVNEPGEVHTEPQTFEQGPNVNFSSKKMLEGEQKEHSSMSDKSANIDIKSGEVSVHGRKRKATTPVQESASSSMSSSQPPSSDSKRSRKHLVEEPGSSSTHELE